MFSCNDAFLLDKLFSVPLSFFLKNGVLLADLVLAELVSARDLGEGKWLTGVKAAEVGMMGFLVDEKVLLRLRVQLSGVEARVATGVTSLLIRSSSSMLNTAVDEPVSLNNSLWLSVSHIKELSSNRGLQAEIRRCFVLLRRVTPLYYIILLIHYTTF